MMNPDHQGALSIGANINAINTSMMSDQMSDDGSSNESTTFDDADLLHSTVHDEVTSQLAAAGPIGVAAAAAIATGKKRKRPHSFETNPSIRKRQQTRLISMNLVDTRYEMLDESPFYRVHQLLSKQILKLKNTIEEYTTRVGQQAVVLCCTPGKSTSSSQSYKVFGSQPLESVIRNCRSGVMQDLDAALAQQAPPQQSDNPALHELPALVIDGIPTPLDKMTQAHLRAFIPEMLKYSTGRSKPGWGKPECRPVWWPSDVPWANVRSDVRTEEQKKKVSWTHALRTIVCNCYKHHGRDDLLPDFHDDPHVNATHFPQTMVQTINNPDGTLSIIQIDTGDVQNPQVVTLADGTQAHVVHTPWHVIGKTEEQVQQLLNGGQQEANQAVQTLAEVAASQHELHSATLGNPNVAVEVNDSTVAQLAEATLNQDGHIILTSEAANALGGGQWTTDHGNIFVKTGNTISGMVTIPVSMYQTVVTSMGQLSDQTATVTLNPSDVLDHTGQEMAPDATQAVEVMTVEQHNS